ncbi:MAG: acetyl-CoA carboxylase, biotin carboxyl carrier protein [Rickettsiales bacterium]|jgi:acetyl-CoA carboxylase biotin carboxyl carrier protein|nr:acetyl-CoA carboxylase, biotin carboxyl carrier protein [Rickettsiales bacterium]
MQVNKNFKELDELINFLSGKLKENNITEIKAKIKDIEVTVSNQQNIMATGNIANATCSIDNPEKCTLSENSETIASPMVGVAYLSPEPKASNYVKVGQSVKAGDTLCLIEAMKTFNPVKASRDGKIIQILVKDGQSVEFETPLFILD